MNFSLDQLLRAAQILVTLGSVAISVYLFLRSTDRATVKALQKMQREGDADLASRIAGLGSEVRTAAVRDADFHTRLSVLETRMQHVPTHQDLLGVRNEIRELNESVSAINERSETTHHMVQMIQQFLMEGGRR